LLTRDSFTSRVSGTLNKDKSFGKQNLFDGQPDSCWASGPEVNDKPHFVEITLADPKLAARASVLAVTYQGGFGAKTITVTATPEAEDGQPESASFECKDGTAEQVFEVADLFQRLEQRGAEAKRIRVTFEHPMDDFGRIVLYSLDLRERN
jgi:hypothetical protein